MDLVFNALPDVFTYQSLRHASYDAPWLQNDSKPKKGKRSPQPQPQPLQQQQHHRRSGGGEGDCSVRGGRDARDSCPLCQEKQRRPLATYIRSKSRQDRREDTSIQEEDEEEAAAAAEEELAKSSPPSTTAPALGAAHA